MAKIGRNEALGHRNHANPGILKLRGDQLFQLLAEVLGDSLVPVGGHNCTIADVKRTSSVWAATAVFCAANALAQAQPLSVYSEFAQIDQAGTVTAPESTREILS